MNENDVAEFLNQQYDTLHRKFGVTYISVNRYSFGILWHVHAGSIARQGDTLAEAVHKLPQPTDAIQELEQRRRNIDQQLAALQEASQ